MNLTSLEAIVGALNGAGVRYLVAGGLAVGAHGYLRFTMDVDLVVQLRADNIVAAFRALAGLGYRPLVPVTAEGFADRAQRERWIEEKGMQVLNFFSDQHQTTSIDVFVTEPFDFDTENDNTLNGELAPGLPVRFVSIPTLIGMKEAAGRPRDLDDIQHLRWILDEKKEMNRTDDDIDWSLTSWEGSRRAQLRRWLTVTVRERLQAIEDLAEVAERVAGSLRPSGCDSATDIPASGAGADKGVPGEKWGPS